MVVTAMQDFYKDKSVFLTGGTGFLGKVFIEKILRATEIKCLYLLVRPKRGKDITERFNAIFKDELFNEVHKSKPNVKDRIRIVLGDCSLPKLGMSKEDRKLITDNVQILVHGAATVRFDDPLSFAVTINVKGTIQVIELAKEMKNLQSFVHVSTAFSHCMLNNIEERCYQLAKVDAQKICKMLDILGEQCLNDMAKQLMGDYPNTYCFTKALAEGAIVTMASELPVCIFRPGIVLPTYREPLEGWVDNILGTIGIVYVATMGIMHVIFMDEGKIANLVPVDCSVNAMMACAWRTANPVHQQNSKIVTPVVYNYVPDEGNRVTWGQYYDAMLDLNWEMPVSRMVWYTFLILTTSRLWYNVLTFLLHTIPGYIFDSILFFQHKEFRMVKTYKKIHKQMAGFECFVVGGWKFTLENTKDLWKSLSEEDQKLFFFDMVQLDWKKCIHNNMSGFRSFVMKESPETIPKCKRIHRRFFVLHCLAQVIVGTGFMVFIYWIFKSFMRLFL